MVIVGKSYSSLTLVLHTPLQLSSPHHSRELSLPKDVNRRLEAPPTLSKERAVKQERPGGAGRGSVEFSSGQGTEEGGEERRATPRAWGGGTNPGAWRGNAKGALRRQGRRHRGWGWGNEKRRKCARGEFAGKGRGQPGGAKQAEAKVGDGVAVSPTKLQ